MEREDYQRGFLGWFWFVYLHRMGGQLAFITAVVSFIFLSTVFLGIYLDSSKPILILLLTISVSLVATMLFRLAKAIRTVWISWREFQSDRDEYILRTLNK